MLAHRKVRSRLALADVHPPARTGGARLKRVHVWISGRVQGVWFRESAKKAAQTLGVVGWVRNRVDGRVEGVFEGPPAAVDQLVAWCGHGPDAAVVTAVEAVQETPTGEFSAFRVER